MRNASKFLTAVVLALVPALASAQGSNLFGLQVQPFKSFPVSALSIAADTEPVLVIKYYGDTPLPKVAVESDSNLTFTVNSVAYAGFECPVSGALGGVIDVSDAACNTLGEVVDVINATASNFSTGYFRAVIVAGLRSDTSDSNFLADAADSDISSPTGEVVFWDSSNNDDNQIALVAGAAAGASSNATAWFGSGISPERPPNFDNPFRGRETVLLFAQENITNAGTVGNFVAYCVVEEYNPGTGTGSETVTTLYQEAGGASTVLGKIDEFINAGGLRCQDGKIVVRILASGADTSAVLLQAYGYQYQYLPN